MKTNLLISIAIFSIGSGFGLTTQAAKEPKAATILAKLEVLHKQRLDADGVIIEDEALSTKFNVEQNKAITQLKKLKMIGHSFTITNSVKTDVVMTVSAVEEKDGTVAGAIVESSRYKDLAAEAMPRAVGLTTLRTGMDAMVYEGQSIAKIVAESALTPKAGGVLTVFYPVDFKRSEYETVKIILLKSTDGHFAFYKEDRGTFVNVYIDLWFNIFTRNFGVDSLTFE